jgi:hypothetical protein
MGKLDEIEARAKAATEGPWNIWDGPEYCGGGADLCIGAGETWLANMDHRYGIRHNERVAHDQTISDGRLKEHAPGDCDICSITDHVTREQQANATFIANARADVPELVAEVRALVKALEESRWALDYDDAGDMLQRIIDEHKKRMG